MEKPRPERLMLKESAKISRDENHSIASSLAVVEAIDSLADCIDWALWKAKEHEENKHK
jgi:hypothetical protein